MYIQYLTDEYVYKAFLTNGYLFRFTFLHNNTCSFLKKSSCIIYYRMQYIYGLNNCNLQSYVCTSRLLKCLSKLVDVLHMFAYVLSSGWNM